MGNDAPRCALSVCGGGSYGTALAVTVARKGLPVCLYVRNPAQLRQMREQGFNARYLPGVVFPSALTLTSSLEEAAAAAETLLLVVPSHSFREVLVKLRPRLTAQHRVAWATKGLEPGSGALLSEVAREVLPLGTPLAALSGPTFALELACGLPTAIAVAGTDPQFTSALCELMRTPTFRIYESTDFIALQLGGAVKNVIAIACGLSDGMGYGANARTALISRGLAEMTRFGVAMGGTEHGFMGLSGLGDLILTCTDDKSRNRRFGYMLGQGVEPAQALERIAQVVEGYAMTAALHTLCEKSQVQAEEMPICSELYEVIYHGKSGRDAAMALLTRKPRTE